MPFWTDLEGTTLIAAVIIAFAIQTAALVSANDHPHRLGAEAERRSDVLAPHPWLAADHGNEQVALDGLLVAELANQVAANVHGRFRAAVVDAAVGGEVVHVGLGIGVHVRQYRCC